MIVCTKVRDQGGSRAISDMLVKFVVRNRLLRGEMGFRPSLAVLPWCGGFQLSVDVSAGFDNHHC